MRKTTSRSSAAAKAPAAPRCAHDSVLMVAYVSSLGPHSAAYWCERCGALGWKTYRMHPELGEIAWRAPLTAARARRR